MADKSLSHVEAAEAIATAKRDAAAVPQSVSVAQPTVGHRIVFEARGGQTKRGARYVADAAILGCFGPAPVLVGGYTLALDGREIRIYMPGSQYRRDVRPVMIPLARPTLNADGTKTTHEADLHGVLAIARLQDAIRDAWATANLSPDPYTSAGWPLTL